MKNKDTLDVLYKLRKEILRSDNDDLKSQIDHAIDKTYRDQLSFSFIGHYSAGKSSLINHLLGTEILPASPVPTTSNTVAVEINEEEEIKAFLNQYQYVNLENYDKLRDINAQDVDIQSILLRVNNPNFKLKTVLQDTPGVDSRTKSHRASTHRFLLNSDYIFFTVEYNHVESEQNLSLLKELVDLNIPLSLIINQVDKHNDDELSFDTFLSRVKHTLETWEIHPERLFTTSIYNSEHNQVDELLKFIQSIEAEREIFKTKYHKRIVQNIEEKQLSYLNDRLEKQLNDVKSNVDVDSVTNEYIETQLKKLAESEHQQKITEIHHDKAALENHIKDSTKQIIKNAYLFPHGVKEPITQHLKIRSGDLQVKGIFGKKKKIDQLFSSTESTMENEMQDVIQTQIDTPVNAMLIEGGLVGQSFNFKWNHVHDRAPITALSNDYILNYLETIKSDIMLDATNQVLEHIQTLDKTVPTISNEEDIELQVRIYQDMLETEYLKQSIATKQYRHFHVRLKEELDKLTFNEAVSYDFVTNEDNNEHEEITKQKEFNHYDIKVYERLRDILENVPRYKQYYSVVAEKLSRLYHNKTNLSVFGGFSAGKTTFINALLQERLLKTSPNPTTATITEVNNESSSIIYKSEEDVIEMLSVITNQTFNDLNSYVRWLNKHGDTVKETHKPFINGLIEKHDAYIPLLGQNVEEDSIIISEKIASDVDATFIHKANVCVNNPFTQNFNIIDSPGINSINQRHTNETKDIITSSDLIVYVSYYNHVFSQSDEDFLRYFKSLKGETFPIVFVINAIDLMKSETELDKVIQYMKNALKQLDIPHTILPVSSMRALTSEDDDFNKAKQTIISLASENKESHQLLSLEVLYQQTLKTVESNLNLYENQEKEKKRIESTRSNSMETIKAINLGEVRKITTVEIDMLFNHIEKQLSLKLYDYLKTQLSTNAMTEKHYVSKHMTSLKRGIEQFVFIQVATSFNSIYRRADEAINDMVDGVNMLLQESNIIEQLTIVNLKWIDVDTLIDAQVLRGHEKALYQSRHNFKSFNETLLQLAQTLAKDVSKETFKEDMLSNMHQYIKGYQSQIEEQKSVLLSALTQPIEAVSDTDYYNDKQLYEKLKELTHD